jgi:hypothetical protein
MNTYTCVEYLYKVLVEIALYFELYRENKFVAVYRIEPLEFCEKLLFLYSLK